MRARNPVYWLLLLGLTGVCFCLSAAEQEDPATKLADLKTKLAETRAHLRVAEKRVAEVNKKYYRFQHEAVYTNAGARVIYEDIHRLEGQLREKREELNRYLAEVPRMRDVMSERRSVFDLVAKLRDKDMLIRKEIRAARWRMATGSEPDVGEEAEGEKPVADEEQRTDERAEVVPVKMKPISPGRFAPSFGPIRTERRNEE